MKAEYTPLPWIADPDDEFAVKSEDWGGICFCYNEPAESDPLMAMARADRNLIVRAANNHVALLTELLDTRRFLMHKARRDATERSIVQRISNTIAKATATQSIRF